MLGGTQQRLKLGRSHRGLLEPFPVKDMCLVTGNIAVGFLLPDLRVAWSVVPNGGGFAFLGDLNSLERCLLMGARDASVC